MNFLVDSKSSVQSIKPKSGVLRQGSKQMIETNLVKNRNISQNLSAERAEREMPNFMESSDSSFQFSAKTVKRQWNYGKQDKERKGAEKSQQGKHITSNPATSKDPGLKSEDGGHILIENQFGGEVDWQKEKGARLPKKEINIEDLYRIGDNPSSNDDARFKRANSKNSIDTDFLHHTGSSHFKNQNS